MSEDKFRQHFFAVNGRMDAKVLSTTIKTRRTNMSLDHMSRVSFLDIG